jgi:purine-nucleoside phosphorylase
MPDPQTQSTKPDAYTRAAQALTHIFLQSDIKPAVGIILGSGLGHFAAQVEAAVSIPYAEIPHFPRATVAGHSGKLVLGSIAGVNVAVMQGRVHGYEGYSAEDIAFPTRVLAMLGCTTLLVTNAAGGIKPSYQPGMLVCIADHINLTGANALVGKNDARFARTAAHGQRFFDMTSAYSPVLRKLAQAEAAKLNIPLPEGVYLGVLGPNYETPAEIRAFRTLGADLVGMSTVQEVLAARHMGLELLGLSLVTNMACGVTPEPIDHDHVMQVGERVEAQFTALLKALIPQIANEEKQ